MRRRVAAIAGVATLATIPAITQGKQERATAGTRAAASLGPVNILTAVNYERQMAGIDPLESRPDYAGSCSSHASYMDRNRTLTHEQSPTAPLFSTDGNWAGQHSVLARNTAGFTADPWKSAPFHEFQVLHPWLRSTGIGVSGDYACMVTLGDRDGKDPSEVKLITAPGFGQYIRPAEVARESPFTPGDEVGLPQGTKTGPHIYVYAVGPERFDDVVIQSVSLTSADDGSQAAVKWVDSSSPRSGRYLEGGAIVFPSQPLKEGVTYGMRVEAATTNAAGQRLLISRTTSFITGPDEGDLTPAPEENDTVSAASTRPAAGVGSGPLRAPTLLGASGQPKLAVSLAWSHTGIRARIACQSEDRRLHRAAAHPRAAPERQGPEAAVRRAERPAAGEARAGSHDRAPREPEPQAASHGQEAWLRHPLRWRCAGARQGLPRQVGPAGRHPERSRTGKMNNP